MILSSEVTYQNYRIKDVYDAVTIQVSEGVPIWSALSTSIGVCQDYCIIEVHDTVSIDVACQSYVNTAVLTV